MMQAYYTILCDPARDLVRITVSGFFSVADVARFSDERAAHYAQLRCAPGQHLTLCDASDMRIQPQDVVAAFTQALEEQAYRSRKLAIIVGSSLARAQTRRVAARDGIRLFRDHAEAEAWLFSD